MGVQELVKYTGLFYDMYFIFYKDIYVYLPALGCYVCLSVWQLSGCSTGAVFLVTKDFSSYCQL